MIVQWNDEDAASWSGEAGQLSYANILMRQNVNIYGPLFQVSMAALRAMTCARI